MKYILPITPRVLYYALPMMLYKAAKKIDNEIHHVNEEHARYAPCVQRYASILLETDKTKKPDP